MNQLAFPEKIDLYEHEKHIERQMRLLEGSDISQENKRLITAFVNHCKTNPKINGARTRKYLYTLRRIGELANKPLKDMREDDITEILSKLQDYTTEKGKPYAQETMNDFRRTISKFWRWLYFSECYGDAPPPTKRLQIKAHIEQKEPEIFTKEEISKLINGMTNIRDKAFFSCLYDLQCRVSELLSRQIKHIRYTEDGNMQILVESGKTNYKHWETLYESVPFFTTWLRLHPLPDEPDAPLWVVMKKEGFVINLRYANVRKSFLLACKRQKIRQKKRSNIHMIRKSKATHDIADGVPLMYVESRGGWSKGSRAIQECYLSIQDKDKENSYKKKYSIPVTNGHAAAAELKTCERCHIYVENTAKFCHKCGFPTDKTILARMQEISKATTELVDKNMLSEMIKKIVLEEMNRNGKGG